MPGSAAWWTAAELAKVVSMARSNIATTVPRFSPTAVHTKYRPIMNDSHKPDGLEYLAEIQKGAADNPDPKQATELLLKQLVSRFEADAGQVSRLDLSKAAYVPFATVGCSPTQLRISSVEEKSVRPEDAPLLGAVRGLRIVHI